jgi:hypothetical protein
MNTNLVYRAVQNDAFALIPNGLDPGKAGNAGVRWAYGHLPNRNLLKKIEGEVE